MSVFAPSTDTWSQPFYEGLAQGELRYCVCAACSRALPYGARVCRYCDSTGIAWRPAAGAGRLCAWVTYRRGFAPEFPPPYRVAMVELQEGVRLLLPWQGGAEDPLRQGAPVRVTVESGRASAHLA